MSHLYPAGVSSRWLLVAFGSFLAFCYNPVTSAHVVLFLPRVTNQITLRSRCSFEWDEGLETIIRRTPRQTSRTEGTYGLS